MCVPSGDGAALETTYTAVEVPHKDDQHPARDVAPRIQALEGVCLPIAVEHLVVLDAADYLGRWQAVVAEHRALEVRRVHVIIVVVAAGSGASAGAGAGPCFFICCCRY